MSTVSSLIIEFTFFKVNKVMIKASRSDRNLIILNYAQRRDDFFYNFFRTQELSKTMFDGREKSWLDFLVRQVVIKEE